jgi:hypothetical protein
MAGKRKLLCQFRNIINHYTYIYIYFFIILSSVLPPPASRVRGLMDHPVQYTHIYRVFYSIVHYTLWAWQTVKAGSAVLP